MLTQKLPSHFRSTLSSGLSKTKSKLPDSFIFPVPSLIVMTLAEFTELNINSFESTFTVFRTNIPHFDHREINGDNAIVKTQNVPVTFFTNIILAGLYGWKMQTKDLTIATKLGKDFFLNA